MGYISLWVAFKEKLGKHWSGCLLDSQHVRWELSGPHSALTGWWVSESTMKNSRRSPSLVKPVQHLWVCMISKGNREQNETKCFHQLSEIPPSMESSALFLYLILKLQVMLASSKEIGDLTLGHGLCLQGKVEETQGGLLSWSLPGKGGLCLSQVIGRKLRIVKSPYPLPRSLFVPIVSRPVLKLVIPGQDHLFLKGNFPLGAGWGLGVELPILGPSPDLPQSVLRAFQVILMLA